MPSIFLNRKVTYCLLFSKLIIFMQRNECNQRSCVEWRPRTRPWSSDSFKVTCITYSKLRCRLQIICNVTVFLQDIRTPSQRGFESRNIIIGPRGEDLPRRVLLLLFLFSRSLKVGWGGVIKCGKNHFSSFAIYIILNFISSYTYSVHLHVRNVGV